MGQGMLLSDKNIFLGTFERSLQTYPCAVVTNEHFVALRVCHIRCFGLSEPPHQTTAFYGKMAAPRPNQAVQECACVKILWVERLPCDDQYHTAYAHMHTYGSRWEWSGVEGS